MMIITMLSGACPTNSGRVTAGAAYGIEEICIARSSVCRIRNIKSIEIQSYLTDAVIPLDFILTSSLSSDSIVGRIAWI